MKILLMVPFIFQGLAIVVDEFYFHYKRGLPKWERIGHPLDSLTVAATLAIPSLLSVEYLGLYIALGIFSCLFVTKDEFVHTELCEAKENWLHAILFLLHPLVFVTAGAIWYLGLSQLLVMVRAQFIIVSLFLIYQTIYWNVISNAKV